MIAVIVGFFAVACIVVVMGICAIGSVFVFLKSLASGVKDNSK